MSGRTLQLARAAYRELSLYSPELGAVEVDLGDNTNAWGAPPAALRALAEGAAASAARYPAPYAADLKAAIGAYVGVAPECVVTGCGSDDVLDSAIRAFAGPGERVAHPTPTFSMIPVFARLNGLEPVAVPLRDDWDVDADALLAAEARVTYLCSPNNPTGTLASRAAVERVVAGAPGVVILDEAYAEFAGASLAARAPGWGNVVVARTFSKAFGLAGLRVGYAVGAPALVAEVEKSRGPYKVNALAERAALAALEAGLPWVREHAALAVECRGRLEGALRAMGLAPLPSAGNFVLVPVPARPGAAAVAARMREGGVAVRPFTGLPRVGDALRITVGPWPMVERALAALGAALAAGEAGPPDAVSRR